MKKGIIMILLILMMAVPVQAGTLTRSGGVNYYKGTKETWYNLDMTRVLDRADRNFGSHHKKWIRDDGVKCYGPYIIAAGPVEMYGEIVETSLGDAIILDTGEFALYNKNAVDIAVDW